MPKAGEVIDLTAGIRVAELLELDGTESAREELLVERLARSLQYSTTTREFVHADGDDYSRALAAAGRVREQGARLGLLAACAIAWLDQERTKSTEFRRTTLELLTAHLPHLDPFDTSQTAATITEFVTTVYCSPPEITDPSGTKTALRILFEGVLAQINAAPRIQNNASHLQLPAQAILAFLAGTRADLGLATLSLAPWKAVAAIAARHLAQRLHHDALLHMFTRAIATLLECVCRDGLLAADLHLHATKPLFSCVLLLTARMHDALLLHAHHISLLVLLALVLLRVHKLCFHVFFLKQTLKLGKFLLLHRSPLLLLELTTYLHLTNNNHLWLEQLREPAQLVAAQFVSFVWQTRDLSSTISSPSDWTQLLFLALPHLVSELHASPLAYRSILTNSLSLISSQNHLLALVEPSIFQHVLSPHPLLSSFSLDLWQLINLAATDSLQRRYALSLVNLILSSAPLLYPPSSPRRHHADSPHHHKLRSQLSRLSQRLHASWRAPALSTLRQHSLPSSHHDALIQLHFVDLLPLSQWHPLYSQLLDTALLSLSPLNSPRSALSLRVASKLSLAFPSLLPLPSLNSLSQFILQHLPSLIHALPACLVSPSSSLASLLESLLSLLPQLNSPSKLSLSLTLPHLLKRSSSLSPRSLSHASQLLLLLLRDPNWTVAASAATQYLSLSLSLPPLSLPPLPLPPLPPLPDLPSSLQLHMLPLADPPNPRRTLLSAISLHSHLAHLSQHTNDPSQLRRFKNARRSLRSLASALEPHA